MYMTQLFYCTSDEPSKPKFSGGYRLFELDSCDNYGKVVLVFKEHTQNSGMSSSFIFLLIIVFRPLGTPETPKNFLSRGTILRVQQIFAAIVVKFLIMNVFTFIF